MPYTQRFLDAMKHRNPPSGVRSSADGLDVMAGTPDRARRAIDKFEADYNVWTKPMGNGWDTKMHMEVFNLVTEYKQNEC